MEIQVEGWALNMDNEKSSWEHFSETIPYESAVSSRSNSAHTHGDFAFSSVSFEWSGTENNGGPHGAAEINFGPTQVILETVCVTASGNEAVYTGVITETFNAPPPPPNGPPFGPYDIGNYFNFKVIDNGEGSNAPADQYANVFLSSPAQNCYTPDFFFWDFFGYSDVQTPGSVQVNK